MQPQKHHLAVVMINVIQRREMYMHIYHKVGNKVIIWKLRGNEKSFASNIVIS